MLLRTRVRILQRYITNRVLTHHCSQKNFPLLSIANAEIDASFAEKNKKQQKQNKQHQQNKQNKKQQQKTNKKTEQTNKQTKTPPL